MEFLPRFFQDPEDSFFLFGPRGTGKSTWVQDRFPGALTVDLLDADVHRVYSSRPERLYDVVGGQPIARPVVVDEIQKAPQLLDVVHKLIEERRERRFILTGSSARKLKRAGVDLLAGRALLKNMHAFMAAELGGQFELDGALKMGMLPIVHGAPKPDETLKAYVGLYVREEVQTEGLVRNIGDFSRFLESISFSHASVLNVSAVARDCQVKQKTVQGYLEILEDLLLGFRVPVFAKRARRQLAQHPKFYYFDAGVYRSVRPTGPLDAPTEMEGSALEGLVAQHLRAWIGYGNDSHRLHYWRTKSGREVDFVVYGPEVFLTLEVKNGQSVHDGDVGALRAFREDYPEADVCLLYRGRERMRVRDVLCLPVQEFLANLEPRRPIALD